MKKLIFLLVVYPLSFVNSEEASYQLLIGSNIKYFPVQVSQSSQSIQKPLSLKFKNWTFNPGVSSFVKSKSQLGLNDNKNLNDILFVKFKYKF
jgi:hypothetical protein